MAIIQALFDIYVYVIILRLLLQAVRVRFDNPMVKFAIKYTQPAIGPFQKYLPEIKNIDMAILLFAFLVEGVKYIVLMLLTSGGFAAIDSLFLLTIADLLRHFVQFYFYSILLRVIFSCIALLRYNTFVFTITQLTEPLLQPIRRAVPLVGGFDLSPLIVLIGLKLLEAWVIGALV